ncbi:antitoxin VbhA family protein, partial [Muribaculum intestinale]|uniref:antitoxin VbhA family protein n=2 Tax=Muribaculum TaxID=1918540 RepID=UPI001B30611E
KIQLSFGVRQYAIADGCTLVKLSHCDNPKIKGQADAWLVSIGLQDVAELTVSALLLDLAIRNVKGEISRDEVSQRLREHYGDNLYDESQNLLDGGYEILPPDSPKIKEIEDYNRKLRPALYAELDKKRNRRKLE